MSTLINKVKNALHSDHTTESTGYANGYNNNTGYSNGAGTGAGYNTNGTAEGVAGPHNSRIANAADPRVDSDLDNSRNMGAARTHGTTGVTGTHATNGGYAAGTGAGAGVGATSTTGNPVHNSSVLNKLDPRVDSDFDGSRNMGAAKVSTTDNAHGVTNRGYGPTTTTAGGVTGTGVGTTGNPVHNSSIANKLDPRVDSDFDGSRNMGAAKVSTTDNAGGVMNGGYNNVGTTGVNGTGRHANGTTAGYGAGTGAGYGATTTGTGNPVHNSSIANKLDPRVDSDFDGSRNMGAAKVSTTDNAGGVMNGGYNNVGTTGVNGTGHHVNGTTAGYGTATGAGTTGTAHNTTAPHHSALLNKLDPRVDTTNTNGMTTSGRDPLDAASVPPSVLREHIGEPQIMHDDMNHDRARRHGSLSQGGSLSHQEAHRGI